MSEFFTSIYEFFYTAINLIVAAVSSFRVSDVIDIAIIAFLLYKTIVLFRDTRSKQILKGISVVLIVWVVARLLNLVMLSWMFTKAVDYIIIAAIIVFHPEIRRGIEHMGYSKFSPFGFFGENKADAIQTLDAIDGICKAVSVMHTDKVGALIVIERNTSLSEIVSSGTVIDAKISPELVCNVFYPKSPLHDGAMIVRDNKIYAAACILPLTSNKHISKELGTRHRAAIGLSESADAAIVVVSEETGNISLALNGKIKRDYNPQTLREELKSILITDNEDKKETALFKIKKMIKTDKKEKK
ncbi:MAG: diadenylate cyclase CdaA [Clostridia bacterium]|nr:diadenylate cyclase CdaA [Clostridia bacterium]